MAKKKVTEGAVEGSAVATPSSERQERWEAFLANAEEQAEKNGTTHIFEAQKANGEFDTIPDSFE